MPLVNDAALPTSGETYSFRDNGQFEVVTAVDSMGLNALGSRPLHRGGVGHCDAQPGCP